MTHQAQKLQEARLSDKAERVYRKLPKSPACTPSGAIIETKVASLFRLAKILISA